MIKIGVCRHFLQRGRNSRLAPRLAPEPSEASLTPSARLLSACCGMNKKWGESGMIKIGVCRHFLQRGVSRQSVLRATPELTKTILTPSARR